MGCSTVETDHKLALEYTKAWEVTEASDVSYFTSKYWRGRVVKADRVEGREKVFFTLWNGDFVTVEKGGESHGE